VTDTRMDTTALETKTYTSRAVVVIGQGF